MDMFETEPLDVLGEALFENNPQDLMSIRHTSILKK